MYEVRPYNGLRNIVFSQELSFFPFFIHFSKLSVKAQMCPKNSEKVFES